MVCPVCGSTEFCHLRTPDDIAREARIRQAFVESRLGHSPAGLEGMDLTHFMHGNPVPVLMCTICGTLRRWNEPPVSYDSDQYDTALLRHLYGRYRDAFMRKRPRYQPLLDAKAEVLEVGSHLGAFLEVAEEWGWKPIGLDIGAEITSFARRQGATVRQLALQDYSPAFGPLDAIFIWNCFEQLEDPRRTLAEARQRLAPHGLLVVRVPNGDFYRSHIRTPVSLLSLGYNNLLGFPYLNGYNPASLQRLLQSVGFETIAIFPTSLLTPPYPDMKSSVESEWRNVQFASERNGATNSPWMELVSRCRQ